MKYVPSLPPPVSGPGAGTEVEALARVRRARPVQERTLPPLVVRPHAQHEVPAEGAGEEQERRHDAHAHGERRMYCRRTEHRPVLIELRSGRERRRHNQRKGDMTDHIDVEA